MGELLWRISGHDLKSHGFRTLGQGDDLSEALCGHCVPSNRLMESNPEGRPANRCIACLMVHGGDLAETHRRDEAWRDGLDA